VGSLSPRRRRHHGQSPRLDSLGNAPSPRITYPPPFPPLWSPDRTFMLRRSTSGFYAGGETFGKCATISRARDDVPSGAQFTLSSPSARAGGPYLSAHRSWPSDSRILLCSLDREIPDLGFASNGMAKTQLMSRLIKPSFPYSHLAHVAINAWP
jgi:hypothetical protein